ncbi:MAG: flagellar hook-basal body complex protein FliE [Lachnospiraceae bacterium]|nr:flagellar hook-basal body complex protein FliE [Lachnospiraceae bacterium]
MDVNAIAQNAARNVGMDLGNSLTGSGVNRSNGVAFSQMLDSIMGMVEETNGLQKDAQQAELNYEMGYSDNTHDLAIAQKKATSSLQYTVAVRDKLVEAYKEIMQMQV